MLFAGSLVFTPAKQAVDLRDWSHWWNFAKDADWRAIPTGARAASTGWLRDIAHEERTKLHPLILGPVTEEARSAAEGADQEGGLIVL